MSAGNSPAERRFSTYSDDVYGWAFRILGRHHDALDVVQDVFVRWHQQCRKSEPKQPKGWLRRVTVNRAIDVHRRRSVRMDARATIPRPTVSTSVQTGDIRHEIVAALDELTEPQRFVLTAKVFDEATFPRIAEELGVSVSTVKTHFLRAVRAVRLQLETHDEP